MKVLLTGSKGQLGSCFQDRLPAGWDVWATDSDTLDITDLDKVKQAVAQYQPDVIVNAAAYTAVDKAETEPELAALINATGPKNLALAAKEAGARLVHVSTDYVFDGKATTPYVETDVTNPLGVYGQTKLDGELAVAGVLPEAIIIRTAWVFSEYGNNFVKTMLRLAEDRDSLNIVADQYGCPTYAGDIAHAIISLLIKNANGGIYHYCGAEKMSWFDFSKLIFKFFYEKNGNKKSITLGKIPTHEYKTIAIRPKYSVLSLKKINELGIYGKPLSKTLKHIVCKINTNSL